MSREFFARTNFHGKTLAVIEQANQILLEYRRQGYVLTLRQLYYRFVARWLLPNESSKYSRLGRTMVDARRAGLIDWSSLEDRTRELEEVTCWGSPAETLYFATASYRADLWENQIRRVEVWIEKAALAGCRARAFTREQGMQTKFFNHRAWRAEASRYRIRLERRIACPGRTNGGSKHLK